MLDGDPIEAAEALIASGQAAQAARDLRARLVAGRGGLLARLTHVHVFHWRQGSTDRLPLADGAVRWRNFLDLALTAPGDRYAMLEFVEGDAPENFLRDAATLKSWLNP